MAHLLGISERRLEQLVKDDRMPRIGRGLYPQVACTRFMIKYWEDRAKSRMGNPTKADTDELKNQMMRTKLAEQTGHLISRKEVMDVWTSTFLRTGKWFDSVVSRLTKAGNLPPDVVKLLRQEADECREDFAKDSSEYIHPEAVSEPAKKRH